MGKTTTKNKQQPHKKCCKTKHDKKVDGLVDIFEDNIPLKQLIRHKRMEGLKSSIEMALSHRDKMKHQASDDNDRPNLVLVSESHARTNPEIVGKPIADEYKDLVPKKYHGSGHLNVVTCLSYGEPQLARIEGNDSARMGTPAFEKLCCILAGLPTPAAGGELTKESIDLAAKPLRKSNKCIESRVKYKVNMMDKMMERGVQLVDVTPGFIYQSSGTKTLQNQKKGNSYYTPNFKLKDCHIKAIIRYSWDHFTKPYLLEQKPRNVVCLGKKVEQAVGVEEFKKLAESIGAKYHGSLYHPSYQGERNGTSYLEEMNIIHRLANPT